MKALYVLILFILSTLSLFAQEDVTNRFSISFSGGESIPIGSYACDNAAQSAVYHPDNNYQWIEGISKKTCGFARTGGYYKIGFTYHLTKHFSVLLQGGQLRNTIQTHTLDDYLSEYFLFPTTVAHDDVNVFYITPGIGYSLTKGPFEIGFNVYAGYAQSDYPYYIATIEYLFNPHYWGHRGEQANLNTLAFGAGITLMYTLSSKFEIGIESSYFNAGFDYTITNEWYPGGSWGYDFDDSLLVQVLNTGLKVVININGS